MTKYLLERWNGGTYYIYFDSIKEIDKYRKKYPEANGEVWTQDGHLVNEEKIRNIECQS